MAKNARALLKQWWDEQYRMARVPSGGIKQQYSTVEEAVAAYRAKGDFERNASPEVAEKRTAVIAELRNFINTDAMLSEELESSGAGDPKSVPNNQARAVWADICTIAAIVPPSKTDAWKLPQLRSMRIQQLAATINTCKG